MVRRTIMILHSSSSLDTTLVLPMCLFTIHQAGSHLDEIKALLQLCACELLVRCRTHLKLSTVCFMTIRDLLVLTSRRVRVQYSTVLVWYGYSTTTIYRAPYLGSYAVLRTAQYSTTVQYYSTVLVSTAPVASMSKLPMQYKSDLQEP